MDWARDALVNAKKKLKRTRSGDQLSEETLAATTSTTHRRRFWVKSTKSDHLPPRGRGHGDVKVNPDDIVPDRDRGPKYDENPRETFEFVEEMDAENKEEALVSPLNEDGMQKKLVAGLNRLSGTDDARGGDGVHAPHRAAQVDPPNANAPHGAAQVDPPNVNGDVPGDHHSPEENANPPRIENANPPRVEKRGVLGSIWDFLKGSYLKKLVREFIGVFIFSLFSVGGSIITHRSDLAHLHWLLRSLIGAAIIFFGSLVQNCIIAPLGGAHVNPMYTVNDFIFFKGKFLQMPGYLIAQFSAGIAVGYIYLVAFSPENHDVGTTRPLLGFLPSILIEGVASAVMTIARLVLQNDFNLSPRWRGFYLSFVYFILSLIFGPFTGCSMNTFRSLTSAIVSHYFHHLEVYAYGPIPGSVIGTAMYKFVRRLYVESRVADEEAVEEHIKKLRERREELQRRRMLLAV